MSSVNSVRIPGLATGMDTDQMIKDMLTGEQSKVDKAKQKEETTKWQQDSYRDIIKSIKGLYDKYFTATSQDFILSSKVFGTTTITSSNSNVISANAGAGASNINYKFNVEKMAQPPRLESVIKDKDNKEIQIDKNKTLAEQNIITSDSTIEINGKKVAIKSTDKIGDVVKRINDSFPEGEVKAKYSEMTGKFSIEGSKTGESSKINVQGEFLNKMGMITDTSTSVLSNKIDKDKLLKEQGISGEISINDKKIVISDTDTIEQLVTKINSSGAGVTASFDGQLKITSNNEIKLSGQAFEKMGIDTKSSTVSSKKLDKDRPLTQQGIDAGTKTINGKEIEINDTDTAKDLVKKINDSKSGVTASFDESTGKITLKSKEDISVSGLGGIIDGKNIERESISSKAIQGSNNSVTVVLPDGSEKIVSEESNSFTIDDIIYNVNGTTAKDEFVSMTSQKDTTKTVEKMKAFIDDYNKVIDTVYDSITEKKNRDYPPLTEAQRKDMSEEEIEKWEKKAKEGILRNDKELRAFMDDIKEALVAPIGGLGITLGAIGIKSDDDYNKSGQLQLDVDKFTKALEENGDLVYKATTGAFEKIKDVTYKYAGSSGSILVKKAGMEKSSTEMNNLFSEQIRKQEEQIKNLTRKMKDKEQSLYKKFASLESNMNRLNSQMSYLMSSMGA